MSRLVVGSVHRIVEIDAGQHREDIGLQHRNQHLECRQRDGLAENDADRLGIVVLRQDLVDDVTVAVDTSSDRPICGSDGNRMLVAGVPVEASAARTASCATVARGELSATAGSATVLSVMIGLLMYK